MFVHFVPSTEPTSEAELGLHKVDLFAAVLSTSAKRNAVEFGLIPIAATSAAVMKKSIK